MNFVHKENEAKGNLRLNIKKARVTTNFRVVSDCAHESC